MTALSKITAAAPDFRAEASWPLRFEAWRDTPQVSDCLLTIAEDAKKAGDLEWYWTALGAYDTGDFSDLEELIEQSAEAERIESVAYRFECRTGREYRA